MLLVPTGEGKIPAIMQCPACDRPDPLESESVKGWITSLRPPA
jgi:hypothetical protein